MQFAVLLKISPQPILSDCPLELRQTQNYIRYDAQGSTKLKTGLDLTNTGCKVLFSKFVKKTALTPISTYFHQLGPSGPSWS